MSGADIPSAAIEAAARGIFDGRDDPYDMDEWGDLDAIAREPYVCHARAALEAAAPHMQAAVESELLDAQRVIALLVSDAGGKVQISRKSLTELPADTLIETSRDVINGGWVIRTRAPK